MKVVFIQDVVPTYRLPFFAGLAAAPGIDLTVLSGTGRENEGFGPASPTETSFRWVQLSRRTIGRPGARIVVLESLLSAIRREQPEVVVTTGAKSFVQNQALIAARWLGRFRLYSFQHAREYRAISGLRRALEWALFRSWVYPNCDGVILYTEHERRCLIDRGLAGERLFYANNTIDTAAIAQHRQSLAQPEIENVLASYRVEKRPSIIYVGRLAAEKDVETLFQVFRAVRARVPETQLVVVGDGPLAPVLRPIAGRTTGVVMTGPVYDERHLACLMTVARFVFVPGAAGLSINHAFAYHKPFVTYRSPGHGPEIAYVVPAENGLVLERESPTVNTDILVRLLTDDGWWQKMSGAARRTAEQLTIGAMVANVARAIQSTVTPV